MLNLKNYRCICRNCTLLLRILINNTANHHVDDIFFCTVFCDEGSYVTTISHDCYTVCDRFDLIEDDDLSFMRNCFCDLTHLLFSDCQILHLFLRIDLNVQILEKLL